MAWLRSGWDGKRERDATRRGNLREPRVVEAEGSEPGAGCEGGEGCLRGEAGDGDERGEV